jgi:hypothetical protein
MQLRVGGASFEQIASTLGYKDHSGARKAVLSAIQKTPHEPAKKYRTLERERLNALWLAMFPLAQAGDAKAAGVCVRIMKRRADFEGFDRPKKVRVKGKLESQVQVKGPAFKVYGFNPADVLPPMPAESQGPPAGS